MSLPPGPAHLLKNLPILAVPPASVFIAGKLLVYAGINVPQWALIMYTILSLPIGMFLRVQYTEFAHRRAAAAHGAVLAPRVYDKWPGGITLLRKMISNLRDGYPGAFRCLTRSPRNERLIIIIGEMFWEWTNTYGCTMNVRILFSNRVTINAFCYLCLCYAQDATICSTSPRSQIILRLFLPPNLIVLRKVIAEKPIMFLP